MLVGPSLVLYVWGSCSYLLPTLVITVLSMAFYERQHRDPQDGVGE